MTWSHERVLAETTRKLTALGINFSMLPEWFDIDTIQDIDQLRTICDPSTCASMKRTRACLKEIVGLNP
jgi:glycosyltransferase A (GT-A) superfamily protein (DUF2064 family)